MGTPNRSIRALAFAITCVSLSPLPGHATTVVGIRTPTQAVIAGDSLGTFRDNRAETTRLVCKIFAVGGAGFAVSGVTKDLPRNFDAERDIAEILSRRKPLSESVDDVVLRLTEVLGSYLELLKGKDPPLYAKSLEGEDGTVTSVLLAAYEGGQPVMIGVGFRGREDPDGRIRIVASRLRCPGDCPDGGMYMFLGEHRAIDRHVAEHGVDDRMPAAAAAPFLVQLVIDAGSKAVGPPVDVLVIDGQGMSWPSRKAGCGDAPAGFHGPTPWK